tara:strand:+ start:20829 stop:28409 length:7581 start_codon:yes stop_codon:yes gene_type:complete
MPQETNLNVAPYFDDFDPQSNYYKVLFKPAYPVQARELNNLQSILQNQVENMGEHFFKEGAKVIPGQLTYLREFYAVQIEPQYLGLPVNLYLDQLVGKRIRGERSGVTAQVITYITDAQSERGNFTLYVNYYQSSSTDAATQTLFDNEVILTDTTINFSNTFISAGEGFCKTLTENSNAVGSAFALSNGVYFLRGTFVDVDDQILILDQYTNNPSYRIGLNVREDIISSDVDPTLTDNAQGFNNFTAPGADRLKITAVLAKKDPDDFDDQNFVQIADIQIGNLRETNTATDYNVLEDELARRTFDESGHYYVKEFLTTLRNSLNNGFGNRGLFNPGQTTPNGNTPSDDLAVVKISSGKAYVHGYEVDVRNNTFLDVRKPRTTKTLEGQNINFAFGPSFEINRVYGHPQVGFNTTNTLSLRSQRVGEDQTVAAGKEIGLARVYDMALESGSYSIANPNTNQWDLTLFDVQTFTDITVNEEVTLSVPTFVEGESSGAQAFLKNAISVGTALTVYNQKGSFFIGEKLLFNGVETNSRTVTDIENFGINNIQSVHGTQSGLSTFSADIVPQQSRSIGIASIFSHASGVSTVTTPVTGFSGIVSTGALLKYSDPAKDFPSFARVSSVTEDALTIVGVTTVTGFIDGGLPESNLNVTDLSIVVSKPAVQVSGSNATTNEVLFTSFPRKNIANVDLSQASITIRRSFDVNIQDGSTNTVQADVNQNFTSFDEERYTLIRSDGSTEALSSDKFVFTNGSRNLQINGLGSDDTGATLVTTVNQTKVTSKVKSRNPVTTILIDKSSISGSGIGGTTLNDGLSYGNFPFGTRVQDSIISLNIPDVIQIYGIFESSSTDDPKAPSMTTQSLDGPTSTTNDLIVGEEIIGSISGSRALFAGKINDTSIEMIYKNETVFERGEIINFVTSGISAIAANIAVGDKNITENYSLSAGDPSTFVDYCRINKKSSAPAPVGKIKVYCLSASYDTSDTGDITTVNSYSNFDYTSEIPSVRGYRVTDIIDGRPIVNPYNVAEDSRSPLEFDGRQFDNGQNSTKNVLATDESINVNYEYYLGRKDRVYVDKDGNFSVVTGAPADTPSLPKSIDGALNIANISYPAYLYSIKDANIQFIDYKRYQMSDIAGIDRRLKNVEYYTSLNMLETSTINQFVPDSNGLNRFKSGIFVDNFTSLDVQDNRVGARNSIDKTKRVLRPAHYTTAVSLAPGNTTMAGIGTTTSSNQDSRFADLVGQNIRRTNQVVTLDYQETSWLRQPFATRSESVTPFLVRYWQGNIKFEPSVDVWIDTNVIDAHEVSFDGAFDAIVTALGAEIEDGEDGNRVGSLPTEWTTDWVRTGTETSQQIHRQWEVDTVANSWRYGTADEFVELHGPAGQRQVDARGGTVPPGFRVQDETDITQLVTWSTEETTAIFERSGLQRMFYEEFNTQSLGDRVVNREIIQFMRSRNIGLTVTKLKPFTQVYPFWDGVDVSRFCFSKLIEIEMISGTFQVGETVIGTTSSSRQNDQVGADTQAEITFRVATQNHKYGPYNNPSDIFERNPYDRENSIPEDYSETSNILNIDTFSLSSEENPEFSGFLATDMVLIGNTSGAQARVTSVRLISDRLGTLLMSYKVPSPNDSSSPTFETGRSRMRLTSSPIDSRVPGLTTTVAEETFYSSGELDTKQETTLSLQTIRSETEERTERRGESTQEDVVSAQTIATGDTRLSGEYRDPLAQSFIVDDPTGVYLTSVDLFFNEVDQEGIPVTVEIREVELGTPSQRILPYSQVDMSPENIQVSDDASVSTKFTFDSPVYLEGQREYAIIIISNSINYRVWISRLGESDVATLDSEQGQILVSSQRLLGSLFKSQNASTWTPSQYEDLTFELFRANFVPNGSIQMFNPELPKSLEGMKKNPLSMDDRSIRVGLGTTVQDSDLVDGLTIKQNITNATGNLVGLAGSVTGTGSITNPGVGYTPSSGYYTFTGVALTTITGNGIDATADVTIQDGVAIAATFVNGGKGYAIGDVVSPIQVGNLSLGVNARISVSDIYGENELILNNVQGEFNTSNQLNYINSVGAAVSINSSVGAGVIPSAPIRITTDGLHFEVFHRNHGMYSSNNFVVISGIKGDVAASTVSSPYLNTTTGNLSIASTANYTTFENVAVAATNPGYIKIGNEILSYTGFANNELLGVVRGVDNTVIENHDVNDLVNKYELNGVSLRRINRTHDLRNVTKSNPINLDTYNVKIDMSDTTTGTNRSSSTFPNLFFNNKKSGGGVKGKASYNLPFCEVVPDVNIITPTGSRIRSTVRTISGSSVNGSESSYEDQGFQEVEISKPNYFDSSRIVASNINESNFLSGLPGNKSFTLNLNLLSEDSRISPAIDLDSTSVVFTSNRTNNPITDYKNDKRVNTIEDDPNRFFYVTKPIQLENPGTSLKVLMDAYVNTFNDIRVFYSLNQLVSTKEAIYVPFPGYQNLDSTGNVINPANNDGNSNIFYRKIDVITSNPDVRHFRELEFSIDELPSFSSFRIKIIGTSTNSAAPPQIRNLRVMALA